ncbi:MAG TPA: acyltransferase [Ktedonobacteraceae bacterium]
MRNFSRNALAAQPTRPLPKLAIQPMPGSSGSVSPNQSIPSLEGLRAFAALGVVALHTAYLVGHSIFNAYQYPWLAFFTVFGNTGVQLFFVLSGFLLFLPYAKGLLFQEKWPSTRVFYLRRALRILPGYYFSLFALLIFVQRSYFRPDHWKQLLLFLFFFMDSSKATFQQINVPYWSLAVEVQFYLLLPLVALGMSLLVKRLAQASSRRLWVAIGACLCVIVVSLIVRSIGLQMVHQPQSRSDFAHVLLAGAQFVFFGVWGKFWEDFALGMIISLCFVYAQHGEAGLAFRHRLQRMNPWTGLAALVVLIFCALWNFRSSYPVAQMNFLQPLVPYDAWLMGFFASLGWGLLLLSILSGNRPYRALFEWKPLRTLGIISYTIYLWHLPMLTLFKKYIFVHLSVTNVFLSHLLYWSFFAVVIIPWCIFVHWLVEKPFMRLKKKQK